MTISMRELSASKGYDYLLRSVAATSPSRAGGGRDLRISRVTPPSNDLRELERLPRLRVRLSAQRGRR